MDKGDTARDAAPGSVNSNARHPGMYLRAVNGFSSEGEERMQRRKDTR